MGEGTRWSRALRTSRAPSCAPSTHHTHRHTHTHHDLENSSGAPSTESSSDPGTSGTLDNSLICINSKCPLQNSQTGGWVGRAPRTRGAGKGIHTSGQKGAFQACPHPNTEAYLEKPPELPARSQKFFLVSSWPFCLICAKVRIGR